MKEYIVGVAEVHTAYVQVEALDEKDALEKAKEAIAEGQEFDVDYSHTLEPDTWTVTEV